jgi:hypothetical protein
VVAEQKGTKFLQIFRRISGLPEKLSGQNSDFHRNFGFARKFEGFSQNSQKSLFETYFFININRHYRFRPY